MVGGSGSNAPLLSLQGVAPNMSAESMAGGSLRAVPRPPSRVCVECGRPVELLFRQYTSNIRLGRCGCCRSVADKYIECEFVLIAIDLALHRIQAYRHLIFNRKPFSTHSFHGRLWQLGVAMAALDAHLRHTALSSEQSQGSSYSSNNVSAQATVDPFWEAGGLLLAAVVEHACFAAGAVFWAQRHTARTFCYDSRTSKGNGHDGIDGDQANDDISSARGSGQGDSSAGPGRTGEGSVLTPSTSKLYMALVYPLFFRLLAAFVMIWDRQVAILNTIELLVATMQFVALSAVIGGVARSMGGADEVGEGKVAAASALVAGLVAKMGVRGFLCRYFGTDARTLTML